VEISVKKAKKPKETNNPMVEEIVEREITFTCPVRGKVTQKVKVKKVKAADHKVGITVVSSDALNDLEKDDDGLKMFEEVEDETKH
jgi:hypothetical protein